jgi:hypothetical protein
MKRKEDAESRKQQETVQQKSVERTQWTLHEQESTGSTARFIVEYDLGSSTHNLAGRQSFVAKAKKESEGTKTTKVAKVNDQKSVNQADMQVD